jgi:hypothetical protein
MEERRKHILSDEDVDRIIVVILEDQNIDKFAAKFEERFARRFYNGVGRGVAGIAWKVFVIGTFGLAAYGMTKSFWK